MKEIDLSRMFFLSWTQQFRGLICAASLVQPWTRFIQQAASDISTVRGVMEWNMMTTCNNHLLYLPTIQKHHCLCHIRIVGYVGYVSHQILSCLSIPVNLIPFTLWL